MRWLVTGGCGFIGTNLVAAILARRLGRVRILDNLSVGTREALASVAPVVLCGPDDLVPFAATSDAGNAVELVTGDVCDAGVVEACCAQADFIVHLAASTGVIQSIEDPMMDCRNNVVGTLNVLEGARRAGARRVVFASSGAPLGNVEPPIHEELAAHPMSPYGASKLAGEGYCSAYAHSFGLPTVALRFGNVFGPGSDHKGSVVAKFIRLALEGKPLEVFGDGNQTRDFIYVEDLVDAVVRAAEVPDIAGEVFQIASQSETSVNRLAHILAEVLCDAGVPAVDVRYSALRPGEMRRTYSDTSKAARLLGWQPQLSLDDGLRRTVAWFLDRRC